MRRDRPRRRPWVGEIGRFALLVLVTFVAFTAAFAVFGVGDASTQALLLPNPYMPDVVRAVHALETASSNAVFGFGLVAIAMATPRGWVGGPTTQDYQH